MKAMKASKEQESLPAMSSSGSEDNAGNCPRDLRKDKAYVATLLFLVSSHFNFSRYRQQPKGKRCVYNHFKFLPQNFH